MATTDVPLQPFTRAQDVTAVRDELDSFGDNNGFALPPTDTGIRAWAFLLGCFLLEGLIWGFPYAFGVFQSYYSEHGLFGESTDLAAIGTTQLGLMYLGLPAVFAVLSRWPQIRRSCTVVGLLISSAALALASVSTTKSQIILTQGVLYALGGIIAYSPTILFVDEWFVRRKGLAYGVMWAGTGVGGFICPIALEIGLRKYSFRTVLRAFSVGIAALTFLLYFLIRPRLPASRVARLRRFDFSFLKDRAFVLSQLGNLAQGLGYFLPTIYLPTYAASLASAQGLSATLTASLTLVLVNVSSVFGCIAMGYLVDRLNIATCIFLSAAGSSLGVLAVWGTTMSVAQLYVFCIIYGLFAGSYTTTYSGVVRMVTQRCTTADPGMVFGMACVARGIGSVVAGPLSSTLLKAGPVTAASVGYGSPYGAIIVFAGVTALAGGISFPAMLAGWT